MKTLSSTALALVLLASVSACGDSGSSDNGGLAEANDQSAANEMMADASNPYGSAEMQMNERMMAAVGTDVSDTWVRKMIEHHRGAVEMSNIALAQGLEGHAREMAQTTIDKQTKEIGELEAMRKQGDPSPDSAAAFSAGESQMHDRMMAAKGADAGETWMRKMIEHHRGAIALSEVAVADGKDSAVREKARKMIADQRKEIAELEAMLAGAPMPVADAPPPSQADADVPKAKPVGPITKQIPPKGSPPPAPKPKTEPKPKEPAPDPHAGHDMNKM
ncbi:MAG TPA: DUF305 domain-containing protein [Allosphingosinicella sp.]